MKLKIIGTGLSGLIGSRVVELLSGKYDFSDLSLKTRVDIANSAQVGKKIRTSKAQVVLHLAAFTDVDAASKQEGDQNGRCYQVNVVGTQNVISACKDSGKYLIYFSTDFVFDGKKKEPYTEEDKPNPIEWYGKTKFWAEEEVKKTTTAYAIVRPAFPFRTEFKPKTDLVRKIIKGLEENSLPPMFADQLITPTFIDDIAYALDVFIQERPIGIYHLVGSTILSPYELACQVADVFGFDKGKIKKGSLTEFLKTDPRPRHQYLGLSNQKIKKELGIKMRAVKEALQLIKLQRKQHFN